jgi:phosphohistidine phosphatase
MNLYLVRHGDPISGDKDPQRPLTERGWSDVRKIGAFIAKKRDVKIDRIFHSGKLRAKETALALAEHLNPWAGVLESKNLLPMDDPSVWAYDLAQVEDDTMLVGHLPYMTKLASLLLCRDVEGGIVDFQTGGIACLRRGESGGWSLQWALNPGLIG